MRSARLSNEEGRQCKNRWAGSTRKRGNGADWRRAVAEVRPPKDPRRKDLQFVKEPRPSKNSAPARLSLPIGAPPKEVAQPFMERLELLTRRVEILKAKQAEQLERQRSGSDRKHSSTASPVDVASLSGRRGDDADVSKSKQAKVLPATMKAPPIAQSPAPSSEVECKRRILLSLERSLIDTIQFDGLSEAMDDSRVTNASFSGMWIPFHYWIYFEFEKKRQEDQIPSCLFKIAKEDTSKNLITDHFVTWNDRLFCRDVILVGKRVVPLCRPSNPHIFVPLTAAAWMPYTPDVLHKRLSAVIEELMAREIKLLEQKAAMALWNSPPDVLLEALEFLLANVKKLRVRFVNQATKLIVSVTSAR